MSSIEIEWIVGHEMAHILNGDMVTMALLQWVLNTFVIFFARIVTNIISNFLDEQLSWIAYFVVNITLQIIFWVFASIIAMKFSRYREFKADKGSAEFLGKDKMIAWLKALQKMELMISWKGSKLATMKISGKTRKWFMILFSSHPTLESRIEALESLKI